MSSTLRRYLIIVVVLIGMMLPSSRLQAQAATIKAVTTVGMITDIVTIVGGERVEVHGLMGPGVDPHLFQAAANDVLTLAHADIIFYGGLHLEGKMAEIFDRLGSRLPTIAVGEAVPADERLDFPGYAGFSDPHIWFDVSYWSLATGRVAEAFSKLDPDHATEYAQRAADYQKRLAALDSWVKESISSIPEGQRVMITSHDAFRYYGRRYGLEVLALQGISTEAEASAEDVRKLTDIVIQRKIPALFIESSVPQRTIEAVQAAVRDGGWDVKIGGSLFSDAMGDAGTLEGTYIGMLVHNTALITKALGSIPSAVPAEISDYQALVTKIINETL